MLCYAMLRYAMLCYAMLCYAMFKIWTGASVFMKSNGQQNGKTPQFFGGSPGAPAVSVPAIPRSGLVELAGVWGLDVLVPAAPGILETAVILWLRMLAHGEVSGRARAWSDVRLGMARSPGCRGMTSHWEKRWENKGACQF